MLGGIYSFLMATVLVALDAVDVAMTEASVGAGISTVLLLGRAVPVPAARKRAAAAPALAAAGGVGRRSALLLVYGTLGPAGVLRPAGADPRACGAALSATTRLQETGVPNVVTAVLASYRGYDTLGETTVVFTAGAGVDRAAAPAARGARSRRRRKRMRARPGPARGREAADSRSSCCSRCTCSSTATSARAAASRRA